MGTTVEKGAKSTVHITVQDDAAGTVKLPVHVVNGSGEGPTLAVTGGMYGTQYAGIIASIRVFKGLDPKKLKGGLILVPVLDMPSFQKGVDRSPVDNLSLNSVFPGDPNGTITRRIAHAVFNEIIKKAQYHLDLRGGDLGEGLDDVVIVSETGKKDFDAENVSHAKMLGAKYWFMSPYPRGNLANEAGLEGIHSLSLLAYKGLGTCDEEDVQKCERGVHNFMKHLKMLDGKPEVAHAPVKLDHRSSRVTAKHGGLLYMDITYGDKVSKGQKIGEIRSLMDETLEVLTSPTDGIALATWPKTIKQPGEIVTSIYPLGKE